jgi:hypothetical protein
MPVQPFTQLRPDPSWRVEGRTLRDGALFPWRGRGSPSPNQPETKGKPDVEHLHGRLRHPRGRPGRHL